MGQTSVSSLSQRPSGKCLKGLFSDSLFTHPHTSREGRRDFSLSAENQVHVQVWFLQVGFDLICYLHDATNQNARIIMFKASAWISFCRVARVACSVNDQQVGLCLANWGVCVDGSVNCNILTWIWRRNINLLARAFRKWFCHSLTRLSSICAIKAVLPNLGQYEKYNFNEKKYSFAVSYQNTRNMFCMHSKTTCLGLF